MGHKGNNNLVCDVDSSNNSSNIGDERNLYVNARELAYWGNLHLNKGIFEGTSILPQDIFELTTSVQSPNSLPRELPRSGFL